MGKLLHKLAHRIMPSWLFTRFRRTNTSSKKLLHFRPRRGISSKSSAPTLPSSSAPLDTELVYLLMDMDQSTYYYSQSEGEQERPTTGNSNSIPSLSIESQSHDVDDHLHASHSPRMGICALAATTIMGRWHDEKHESPFANKEIKYPTSPASIDLQSQYDSDDHQHSHQHEGCVDHPYLVEHQTRNLTRSSREKGVMVGGHHDNGHCGHSCHHQHQHQPRHDENHQHHHVADGGAQSLQHHAGDGPCTNQRPQHHAGDGSLCKHDDNVYHHAHHYHHNNHHVYEYRHHGQTYGSNNSKHSRTKPNMGSRPIPSLATMGTQHNFGHHHPQHRDQCQSNDQYYQHNASNSEYHQPHLGKFKRKSICLEEDDGKEDGNDENNHQYSIRAWPCMKRQKTQREGNVAYELPECICEMVGNGTAVVQYSYQNPQFSFWESMVDMIVSNELWGEAELEFLLHCYLALNDPPLHYTICTSFLQVLKDLQQSLPLQKFPSMAQVDKVNAI